MSQLSPSAVFFQVSEAVPESCRGNIVIIGSLAAGYHFYHGNRAISVRTKDVDCILEPFQEAVSAGRETARQLLDAGWQRRQKGEHVEPGDESTPEDQLPAVRLYPPGVDPEDADAWFIEFLTVPESEDAPEKSWTRMSIEEGHFGIPSFRFLSITAFEPLAIEKLGIRYARPEMMALANLLEHPEIKPERMSGLIAELSIKRSNKDLGRVIAIAVMADLDDYGVWRPLWEKALQHCFPSSWKKLASRVGGGLRELLNSEEDFKEAYHTCINGLLSSKTISQEALHIAGERMLVDLIEPLEASVGN